MHYVALQSRRGGNPDVLAVMEFGSGGIAIPIQCSELRMARQTVFLWTSTQSASFSRGGCFRKSYGSDYFGFDAFLCLTPFGSSSNFLRALGVGDPCRLELAPAK